MTAADLRHSGFDAVFGTGRGDGLQAPPVTAQRFDAGNAYVRAAVELDLNRWGATPEPGGMYPCPAPGSKLVLEDDPDLKGSPFELMDPHQLETLDARTGGKRRLLGTVRSVSGRHIARRRGQSPAFWVATSTSYVSVEFTDQAGHPLLLTLHPPLFGNWKPVVGECEYYKATLTHLPQPLEAGATVYALPYGSEFEGTFPQVTMTVTDELLAAARASNDEDASEIASNLQNVRAVYGDEHLIGLNLEFCEDRRLMHVVRERGSARTHLVVEPGCRIRCIVSTTENDDDGYTIDLPASVMALKQVDWDAEPGGLLPTWLHQNVPSLNARP